jgi:hypothetical protein
VFKLSRDSQALRWLDEELHRAQETIREGTICLRKEEGTIFSREEGSMEEEGMIILRDEGTKIHSRE